ncbi:SpoIIAA-like protein [Alteromonadaceae bacterium 2753L.S.0a.02]|nr:SpoIIAA-like protein [Alteromonadaceae bacterium 2753L.S.0a.02]
MLTVERVADDRLDIAMSGKLDSDGMRVALDTLVESAEGIENGGMLFEVIEYNLPSLGAVAVELSRFPQMLRFIRKFKRAAVLSDETWLKTISEWEGKLIPGLTIKAFNRTDKIAAIAWLQRNDEFPDRI